MELKTLKDIDCMIERNGSDFFTSVWVVDLRAEAVKWIKGDLALFEFGSKTWKFIYHFFNLTEEDLNGT